VSQLQSKDLQQVDVASVWGLYDLAYFRKTGAKTILMGLQRDGKEHLT
jgi:hypothetical protein